MATCEEKVILNIYPHQRKTKKVSLKAKGTGKKASAKWEMVLTSPAFNLLNKTNIDCKNELGVKD